MVLLYNYGLFIIHNKLLTLNSLLVNLLIAILHHHFRYSIMYHVCIFTDATHEKLIVTGGLNESEIHNNLKEIVALKYGNRNFSKLVVFKTFMLEEEGMTYLNLISKFDAKDLLKIINSENGNFADLSKHLVDQ